MRLLLKTRAEPAATWKCVTFISNAENGVRACDVFSVSYFHLISRWIPMNVAFVAISSLLASRSLIF